MVLPTIKVEIEADASGAVQEINLVDDGIDRLGKRAPTTTRATGGLVNRLKGLANVSKTARGRIQQTSFQLQDIAVQLQAGTSATTTFTQQVPQLLGAYGAIGAAAGVLASVAIPAIGFAFSALREDSIDLEDRIDNLKDLMGQLESATDLLSMSIDSLTLKYGENALRVRQFTQAQAQLHQETLNRQLAGAIDEVTDALSGYTTAIQKNGAAAMRAEPFTRRLNSRALRRIADDFNVTRQEAEQLSDAINKLARADTLDEQQQAAQALLDLFTKLNIPISELPEDLQQALSVMIDFSNQADEARVSMERAAAAAEQIGQTRGIPLFEQGFDPDELLPPARVERERRPRRPRRDPVRGQVESLVKQLRTEQEVIEQFREEGFRLLQQATDKELELIGGREEAKFRLQKEYMDRLRALQDRDRKAQLRSTAGLFNALASLTEQGGGKLFEISKGLAIAGALINTYEGITEALKLPPPLSYTEAARIAAIGFAQVASISRTKPNTTGGGGGSAGSAGTSSGGGAGGGGDAGGANRTFVNVNLTGEGAIGRGQVRGLIQLINEEIEDGAVLGGIRVSGA